jgi:hypothetical protein
MNSLFLGVALLLTSGSGAYAMYDAIKEKSEVWWFRLIELIFSFLFFTMSIFIASFIH